MTIHDHYIEMNENWLSNQTICKSRASSIDFSVQCDNEMWSLWYFGEYALVIMLDERREHSQTKFTTSNGVNTL